MFSDKYSVWEVEYEMGPDGESDVLMIEKVKEFDTYPEAFLFAQSISTFMKKFKVFSGE